MRYKPFFSTPFVASLTIGFIFFALFTLLFNLPNRQIIQKNAANSKDVYIYFVPSDTKINTNQITVSMYAKFATGTPSERVDYFKTKVILPTGGQLVIPPDSYVKTTFTGNTFNLDRIFHVDGPTVSNANRAIMIELGSKTKGAGPTTDPNENGGAGLKVAEFVVQRNPSVVWPSANGYMPLGFIVESSSTQVVVAPLSEIIPPTSTSSLVTGSITYDPTVGITPTSRPVPTNTPIPTHTPTPLPPTPTPQTHRVCQALACTNSVPPNCNYVCVSIAGPGVGECKVNADCISVPTPTAGTLPTLTVAPTSPGCSRKHVGDANCDGVIDGIDYSIWLNSQCHPQPGSSGFCNPVAIDHDADFNQDNNRDDTDYIIWFNHRWL